MAISKTHLQEQREKERQWAEDLKCRREANGYSEVRLHHMPNWLRLRCLKLYGAPRFMHGEKSGLTNGWSMTQQLQDRGKLHIDHHGSVPDPGGGPHRAFVSEPYSFSTEDETAWKREAERLGCRFLLLPDSWWNPGSCLRAMLLHPDSPFGNDFGE